MENVNQDEQIRLQMEQIEREVAHNQAFISDLLTIDTLKQEYSMDDTIYQLKIKYLSEQYKCMRKIRGDGNCFFRAFVFSYMELLLLNDNEQILQNFKIVLKEYNEKLIQLGYCKFTVDDFFDTFIDTLNKINVDLKTSEDLIKELNSPGVFDFVVVCLRLVVSCYLQMNSDSYEGFIDGYLTIKDFCSQEVEPMNRESDHIHVLALTQALKVSIRVVYVDRSTQQSQVTIHNFPEDKVPIIHVLYRPGHYDILYNTK